MNIKKIFKKKDVQLVTAKKAFESTKQPQLEKVIKEINESRQRGRMSAYVGDNEELHKETIEALLNKGYDITITHYSNSDFMEWFNRVFWDKEASGKIRKKEIL